MSGIIIIGVVIGKVMKREGIMQTTVLLVPRLLDITLRVWMKDEDTYLVNNVLDIERLAVKIGCDY